MRENFLQFRSLAEDAVGIPIDTGNSNAASDIMFKLTSKSLECHRLKEQWWMVICTVQR
jgi:hypothetical protein